MSRGKARSLESGAKSLGIGIMDSKFTNRVYEMIEKIPDGKITTYGRLAERLGSPGASRSVGTALKRYPGWEDGNCYRVVTSDGKVGGYCGQGFGTPEYRMKKAKLEKLGCLISPRGKILNFEEKVW